MEAWTHHTGWFWGVSASTSTMSALQHRATAGHVHERPHALEAGCQGATLRPKANQQNLKASSFWHALSETPSDFSCLSPL